MIFADWLSAEGAHHDLVSWARASGDGIGDLWERCPRGDWLLGMAAKLGAERASLVLAACAAARTAFELLPDDELRPEAALTAIEATVGDAAWETGLLSEHQSALEALAESASDPTVNAVAEAVLAALASTSDPAAAAGAAALAAQASVFDAGDCAMMAALGYAQNQSANAVRHHLAAKWAISAFDSAQGE